MCHVSFSQNYLIYLFLFIYSRYCFVIPYLRLTFQSFSCYLYWLFELPILQQYHIQKQMTKWNISLNPSTQSQASSIQHLPIPFGYQLSTTVQAVQTPKKKQMLDNKLYELAMSPKMQLFMAGVLMFFLIGNTVTIYSILAVFQSLFNSISCILKTNKTFQSYENMSKSLLKYKLIYISLNTVILGVVLFKLSKMGLLSFSSSAYIDMIPPYVGKEVIAPYH